MLYQIARTHQFHGMKKQTTECRKMIEIPSPEAKLACTRQAQANNRCRKKSRQAAA